MRTRWRPQLQAPCPQTSVQRKTRREGLKTLFSYTLSLLLWKKCFFRNLFNSLPHISYSAKVGHLRITRSITGIKDWSRFVALDKGLTNYGPRPNPDWCLFLWIKFYWNTGTPIHIHTAYGCFVLQWQNCSTMGCERSYELQSPKIFITWLFIKEKKLSSSSVDYD